MYVAKNSSHGATCETGPAPLGPGRFCAKAKCSSPSGDAEGLLAIVPDIRRMSGTGLILAEMFLGTFQRNSAMTSISHSSFFGSSRTATQDRAGFPVKYSA